MSFLLVSIAINGYKTHFEDKTTSEVGTVRAEGVLDRLMKQEHC